MRGREGEGLHVVLDKRRDGLHARQHLHARLGLCRLARLGLEPIDEGLDVTALIFLLFPQLDRQGLLFPALPFEGVIAAAIELQPTLGQMENEVDRPVQEIAIVADDENGMGIVREVVLEPERALKVEIVRRLVEQQEVGFGEQQRGKGDAHAPAAGELGAGALLRRMVEAEAGEDGGRARGRRMGVLVDEAQLDLGDPMRIASPSQPRQAGQRAPHRPRARLDEAFRAAGRLLRDAADARPARHARRCQGQARPRP